MLIMSLLLGFSIISSLHINYFCVLLFWWLTWVSYDHLLTQIIFVYVHHGPQSLNIPPYHRPNPVGYDHLWDIIPLLRGVILNVVCTIGTRPTYKCHASINANTWIRAWYSRRCLKAKFHRISLTIVGQIWQPWSYVYNLSRRHHNQSVTEV